MTCIYAKIGALENDLKIIIVNECNNHVKLRRNFSLTSLQALCGSPIGLKLLRLKVDDRSCDYSSTYLKLVLFRIC